MTITRGKEVAHGLSRQHQNLELVPSATLNRYARFPTTHRAYLVDTESIILPAFAEP